MELFNTIHHINGKKACNQPSCLLDATIGFGDRPTADDILHIDGTSYETGDKLVCDSCGILVSLSVDTDGKIIAVSPY